MSDFIPFILSLLILILIVELIPSLFYKSVFGMFYKIRIVADVLECDAYRFVLFHIFPFMNNVYFPNIDAAKEAARFGIDADRAVNYKCDEEGTALNYEVISAAVCSVRSAQPLSADWKRRIDEDVKKRGR